MPSKENSSGMVKEKVVEVWRMANGHPTKILSADSSYERFFQTWIEFMKGKKEYCFIRYPDGSIDKAVVKDISDHKRSKLGKSPRLIRISQAR